MKLWGVLLAGMLLAADAHAANVTLQTSDGVELNAMQAGSGAKGVVLVHGDSRSSQDWKFFAEKLAHNGFNVVAVDLRGHGASKASLTDEDYPKMTADVTASIAWLKSNGATSVSIVGAGLGANLALNAAVADESVKDIVMMSPGLNIKGVKVSGAIGKWTKRPVLFVAGADDAVGAKAAKLLEKSTKSEKHLKLLPKAGSGAQMLNRAPELEDILVSWLNGTFLLAEGDQQHLQSRELQTGSVDDIETTGTKLEDRYK